MPVFSAGATYLIGKVFIQHFASGGTLLDFNPPDYREFIKARRRSWTRQAAAGIAGRPLPKPPPPRATRLEQGRRRRVPESARASTPCPCFERRSGRARAAMERETSRNGRRSLSSLYIMFCLLAGLCGSHRRMGFFGTFMISLVVTPVVVLLVLLLTAPSPPARGARRRPQRQLSAVAVERGSSPQLVGVGALRRRNRTTIALMSFFQLVRREMQGSLHRLVVMSGLGGVSNAAILAAINAGAQAAGDGKVSVCAAALFVVALLLFIKTQHYILITTTVEIEAIIHKLRVRLMDQVRHSELLPLDAIGRAEIVAAITKDTATLTQATNMLAFAGAGRRSRLLRRDLRRLFVAAGLCAERRHRRRGGRDVPLQEPRSSPSGTREAAEWENRLFDRLIDLLDGFKEVRLNRRAATTCSTTSSRCREPPPTSRSAPRANPSSGWCSRRARCTCCSPRSCSWSRPSAHDGRARSPQVTTALMFVVGVCIGLVQTIPILTAANAAADNIERLEARLRAIAAAAELGDAEPREALRQDRDAQYRVPLCRQVVRGRLPGRARWTSPCGPAISSSSPAATVRANRRS